MNKIPLMNLTRQYENIKEELDDAALGVMSSGMYIMGDNVKTFEKNFSDYTDTKYAVGVGNGTDALIIALKSLGIKFGDEVILSAMSFFASAEAIASVGAIPVFVDCTEDTYLIDVNKIEEKITAKTKAIMAVHLYGQCCDMDEIKTIANKYKLKVIEDAAQAVGAEYKGRKAGSLGDVACFSFFPTKNLGCAGDGGIITTNDEVIAKKTMAYRVHGSGENGLFAYNEEQADKENISVNFDGNQPKYFNFVVGYNSRLDAIQAKILDVKLPYLNSWNDKRIQISNKYTSEIANDLIKKPLVRDYNKHVFYVYISMVEDKEKFRNYLNDSGITTGVYFPIPLHLQKVFGYLGYKEGDMPNAEKVAEQNVAIPIFPELTEEEIKVIINKINAYGGTFDEE